MIIFLAQSTADEAPSTIMPALWNRLDALARPEELVDVLQGLSLVWAGIFIAVGLACLVQGYKLYKGVVLVSALSLGGIIGYQLGQKIEAEIIVAGCLGVLLAVVAWPFMKYAVSICGGLAGAVVGANAWSAMAEQINNAMSSSTLNPESYWAGALMGVLLFGLLSFILFELSVVLFTSVSGSILAILGILSLILQVPLWKDTIGNALKADPLVIPLLVLVPAIMGLVAQHHFGGMKKQAA